MAVTHQDLFVTDSALWILAYLLIGWLALCCIEQYQLKNDIAIAAGIAPLLWSQLNVPNLRFLISPDSFKSMSGWSDNIAGMEYHNFPQAWSVLLGFGFLYCFQQSQSRENSFQWFLAALLNLIVSAWIKPSLIILLAPALLICMLVNRNGVREWITFFVTMAIGLSVYMLSAFMVQLPAGNGWIFTMTHNEFTSYILPNQWIPILIYFGLEPLP
ncbi:MAG: hypothetical protein R3C11_05550 [Planctomycetaceae bacterium]